MLATTGATNYIDGDIRYEDIESAEPEKDEAKAVRVRKALVDLDVVSALVPLLSSAATEVVVSASGALFNAALGLAGAERIRSLDGALPLLLGKCGIAHADARVRANTAGILQNVAAHCDAAREQLAVAGALSALLDLATREAAETGDVNVVARCVSAINNLALLPANARALCAPGAGQEAQDAAQLADAQIGRTARSGLGSLLELLGSVEREDVLEDASLAVVQILRVEVDACAELVTLEGLPVVKSLMAHMDEELQVRGCQLLQLCAKSDVRTHAAALELALELPLVERLGSAAEEVQEAAVLATTALFVRPQFGRAFRKAEGISVLVELLSSQDESLLAAALYCLGQLAATDTPSRARIRDDGGLEPMARLLTHGSTRIAAAAAHVLRFSAENEEVKRVIRELGAIPTLCKLLAAGEADTLLTTAATGALSNLCLHEPEGCALVRRAGGLEAAMPQLLAQNGLLALLTAQLFERAVVSAPDNRAHFRMIGALGPLVRQLGATDAHIRLAVVGVLAQAAHLDPPNQVRLRELGAALGLVALLALPAEPEAAHTEGSSAAELSLETKRRACWALSHLACEPIGAAAVREAGGHAALLAVLSESSKVPPLLVAAGTSCLFNCAMNDGRQSANTLRAAGAVGFALRTLAAARGRGDVDTAAYAAGILMNLCLVDSEAATELAAGGGLEALLECALPSLPPMLTCNAAGALCNVAAHSAELGARLVALDSSKAMVTLIDPSSSEQPPAVVNQAGSLLANLVSLSAGRDAAHEAGAARAAVDLFDEPDVAVKAVSARVLSNMSFEHHENAQSTAEAGGMVALLSCLVSGQPTRVLDVTVHSEAQLASAQALRNLTVYAPCVEALLETTVEPPANAPAAGGTGGTGSLTGSLTGLGALVVALTLGQPHESIKAKASVAGALANCATLAEARSALEKQQLLPLAVDVLAEALRPMTRAKALAQAGGEQPDVADSAEMDTLLVELCANLCMLLRNAALSPACKAAIAEQTPAVGLLVAIVRNGESPGLLAHAAGALQNIQDRSEVRPGVPTNPIGQGERSMLKVHQLKQRLHAAGEEAEQPLPPALSAIDDETDDAGPGTRTKRAFKLIPTQKLGATHDVKELKGPYTAEPIVVKFTRESAGCSRRQPLDLYVPVPSPFPSPPSTPR